MAQGTVLEAQARSRAAARSRRVLVQDGTLSEGDLFIAGTVDGKVRALFDHLGRKVKKAGPATPVEVLGLSALPQPGDTFQVIDDPIKARQVVAYRQAQAKEKALGGKGGRAHARVAAAADGRRRHEGTADHHQGRRAGLGRSAGRHARPS